jgi:hypothetical protein
MVSLVFLNRRPGERAPDAESHLRNNQQYCAPLVRVRVRHCSEVLLLLRNMHQTLFEEERVCLPCMIGEVGLGANQSKQLVIHLRGGGVERTSAPAQVLRIRLKGKYNKRNIFEARVSGEACLFVSGQRCCETAAS